MDWRSNLQPSMRPRRQDLWRKLIEATLTSITERGYPATTVSHITDIAGVNRTQFYFLFQDKDECFVAVQEAVFGEIEQRILDSGAAEAEDWPATVSMMIEAVLALFDEQPTLARVAVLESSIAGPLAQAKQVEAKARLMPCIEGGLSIASEGRRLPSTVADMALGSATALLEKELRSDEPPHFERLAPDIFFAILTPFVGPVEAMDRAGQAYAGVVTTVQS